MVFNRSNQEDVVFNALERAPSSADPSLYSRNFSITEEGAHSIGIPGEIAGLHEAWKRFGRLPWSDNFQQALCTCIGGASSTWRTAAFSRPLADSLLRSEGFRKNYFDSNCVIRPRHARMAPELCRTIQRISQDPETYYRGDLAKDIILDIADEGANWTLADLAQYTVQVTKALRYRLPNMNRVLLTTPEPTLGRVLGHAMKIIDGFQLTSSDYSKDPEQASRTARSLHKVIEALKFGFGLRSSIGDFSIQNDTETLRTAMDANVSSWADSDRMSIKPDSVLPTKDYFKNLRPADHFAPFAVVDERRMLGISAIAVDQNGLIAITATTSGSWLGSKRMGRRTGVIFNNAMSGFSPAVSPITRTRVNWVKPNAQPASTLVPAILLKESDGTLGITCAAGGAQSISAAAFNLIYRTLLQTGDPGPVMSPRLHSAPNEHLYHELTTAAQQTVLGNLTSFGHVTKATPDVHYLQHSSAIYHEGNSWSAYPDHRQQFTGAA
jgi:gamma-glutamyltranspeptidase / glutathione hydrolase / leukotriene-C4 hydrolase